MYIYPIICKFATKTKIHIFGFIGYKHDYIPYGSGCNKFKFQQVVNDLKT